MKVIFGAAITTLFLALSSTLYGQTLTSPPFPETQLTSQEQTVLVSVRTVVEEVNRMSELGAGSPGYVDPRWVTLYQARFDSPTGSPNRTRQADETRDATGVLLLWRNGSQFIYSERIQNTQTRQAQCVIRFTPDFWALGPGADLDSRIAHETYHCFQLRHKRVWNPATDFWFFEGGAQVVGDYFADRGIPASGGGRGISQIGHGVLGDYLTQKKSLFERDYDVAPFLQHVADRTSMNDLLARLQTLYTHKVANPDDAGSHQILRMLVREDEKQLIGETWGTRLWQGRGPYPDLGEDWSYNYFDVSPPQQRQTEEVDFTDEDLTVREVELYPAQPEVIEVTVQPNVYYRITVEKADARSIGYHPGGSGPLEHRYHGEEMSFTFCVGEGCECPSGSRAYEFEILDDPEEDQPHLIIAATATEANEAGQLVFGKVKIEQLPEPPCCTGGLQPREDFPDITGQWRFRDTRLQTWANNIRATRVEVYEEQREANCTPARVDNRAAVSISAGGAFVADYGLTSVEFACTYDADRGTTHVERTWKYEWWGQYDACVTLQEADGFRAGYPERTNPVLRPLVESWFDQLGIISAYNSGLDEGERAVTVSPYQPSATANAFWYDVASNIRYRQTLIIESNGEETEKIVDECTIDHAMPNCEQGALRLIGEYHFFTPDRGVSWLDVFGSEESATGLYAPLPFYFQEFGGGSVEYPNLVR